MTKAAVLGAGAWGTAISCVLAARLEIVLWARDATQAAAIARIAEARYNQGLSQDPAEVDANYLWNKL